MKRLALLPLLVLPLAACGGGDTKTTADSSSTSSTSSSAIKYGMGYSNLDALRAAVQEAGIQCPDSTWKPEATPTSESMTGDGWCGDTVRIATTKEDAVSTSEAMAMFASDTLRKTLDSANSYTAEYVKGPNWIVQVPTKTAQQDIITKMGGEDPTPDDDSSSSPTAS